ncbi:hypothetical protein Tco_0481783 [Tanacetum coccineum]
MEAKHGKFHDMIRAIRINTPSVDILAGMPNYGKFPKELVSNKNKLENKSHPLSLAMKVQISSKTKFHPNSETPKVSLFLAPLAKPSLATPWPILAQALILCQKSVSNSDKEEITFKKITFDIDYKIQKSLDEPTTDLQLKPLPDHLEYAFLEEPSFLPVVI